MTKKIIIILTILIVNLPVSVFAQQGASAVRDYVGVINQSYHPDIVSYFEKLKANFAKQGETNAMKTIDIILSGAFGSGFLYSDARGNFYVLTNNHVIAQAHSPTIKFERTDGTTLKIENLTIIATDEENDLAILALPQGQKPFAARGMLLLTNIPDEGINVFAAGFPGLGRTPLWQFSSGMISNSAARFPKSSESDIVLGPFIQHTAQIDPGNSGGPLLVAQANAPSGYAVAGINTLSAIYRQSANYAIPSTKIAAFVNDSLNPKPETFRAALDEKLTKFIEGLGANSAVYPHIAEFLSSACVGENAEFATETMDEKANNSVRRAFIKKAEDSIVGAMGLAVAWTIESSIRGKSTGALKGSVKEVTGEGEEYTVVFTINNSDVSSVWVREYGNWKIKKFGTVAAGDKKLVEKREKEKKAAENLRVDSGIMLELGYAYLFDAAPAALYAQIDFRFAGFEFFFADPDLWSLGFWGGYTFGIPAGQVGFMPYIRAGLSYVHRGAPFFEEKNPKLDLWGDPIEKDTIDNYFFENIFLSPITFNIGTKFTTAFVPGLYLDVGFRLNFVLFGFFGPNFENKKRQEDFKRGLYFGVGYAF